MRTLTEHQVNPANDRLTIQVLDEPGAGGASHVYQVEGFELWNNPSANPGQATAETTGVTIHFQNGPIAENGLNGLTQEVLLAIVADRLRSFQDGQYRCRGNALALTKIEEAQHWLASRTKGRMARGVEGTHKV